MRIYRTISELRNEIKQLKLSDKVISFVPTMGYLHEGHLTLIRYAKRNSDFCVVSIFVNPTQFGPNEDYNIYPRDEKRDIELLEKENCDFLFIPSVEQIYGADYQTFVKVKKYSDILEGEIRPNHFEGVTTIVLKLFNIVQPDFAVFGQKDAQQAFIVKKMVEDLNLPIRIDVLPIVREPDGLAMSSRNVYLSREERSKALSLFEAIKVGESLVQQKITNAEEIKLHLLKYLMSFKLDKIDYIEIVEKNSFEKVNQLAQGKEYYLLLAVRIGKTRLIDNTVLKID